MWRLAVATLRFRRTGQVAAFVAMALGTAIVLACGGLMETGIRTAVPPQQLAAAAVVVTGNQAYQLPRASLANEEEDDPGSATLAERVRVDAGLVGTVQTVPGAVKAVGEVSFPAAVLTDGQPVAGAAQPQGHNWASAALTPYSLRAGTAPARPGQVVLDAALAQRSAVAVGDRVRVAAGGTTGTYRVTGVAAPARGRAVTRAAVFFSAADARRLSGHPGTVDAIGVLAAPGTDVAQLRRRVAAAVAGQAAVTLAGDDRGLAEFPEAKASSGTLIAVAAVFSGIAVMVAVLVVAGTLALSVQQRQREMALLRAIGATPRQVRRMILAETLAVAVFAAAAGCLPGAYLGRWLLGRLAAAGLVSPAVAFRQGWVPAVTAAGVALVTALAAALVAGRRAAVTPPSEMLAEADVQRRWLSWGRLLAALVFLAGGAALGFVTMTVMSGPVAASTAGPTVMVFAFGLALLGPGVTRAMTAVLQCPLRALPGLAGELAVLNARAQTVRMAGAAMPIMLAVGIATALLYVQTTQVAAAERAYTQTLRADVVLTSTMGGLAPGLLGSVESLPGVAGASEYVTSTGFIDRPHDRAQDKDGWPLRGVTAGGAAQTTAVSVTAGTLAGLRGNTVALSAQHARELGRSVGDTIRMRLGDGAQVELRVVALYVAGSGDQMILLPARLLAAHTTVGLPTQILVRAAPGASARRLTTALTQLARRWPGVTVVGRGALAAAYGEQQQTQAWVNYLLVGMIVVYTAISVVNTLVLATVRRRREFALLRLTGSTRGQVLRMMSMEGTLIAAIGIALGTAVSATALVPFSVAASDSLMPSGPRWIYPAVIGTAFVLALTATLLPTWQALRSSPADAAAPT
jgi:putative ABC transport system permease protein